MLTESHCYAFSLSLSLSLSLSPMAKTEAGLWYTSQAHSTTTRTRLIVRLMLIYLSQRRVFFYEIADLYEVLLQISLKAQHVCLRVCVCVCVCVCAYTGVDDSGDGRCVFFGREWLVLGSYGEQMVNRLHCSRLSGMAAMRFPLRCHRRPFRRAEWLVGHGPSWATTLVFFLSPRV